MPQEHPFITEAVGALSESGANGHTEVLGNLRWSANAWLSVAWGHLKDVQDGQGGPESLARAGEALDAAIAQIAFLRRRLRDLDEAQEAEALSARGFVQLENGGWGAPEGFTMGTAKVDAR
jgi:hypothetical protein